MFEMHCEKYTQKRKTNNVEPSFWSLDFTCTNVNDHSLANTSKCVLTSVFIPI